MKYFYGRGVNDADYKVTLHEEFPPINGKRNQRMVWKCEVYSNWTDMLKRCYCTKYHAKYPSYVGCTVQESWLLFSNFERWARGQDFKGKHLDKDFLFAGNTHYSETTCVFLDKKINLFDGSNTRRRGEYKIGVSKISSSVKFRARCKDPFDRRDPMLGWYLTEDEAHEAWRERKHKYACELASSEHVTDDRVAAALRLRYYKKKVDTKPVVGIMAEYGKENF